MRRSSTAWPPVCMIAIGLYHLAYMTFTREGRKGLRDLWLRVADARDAIGVLRFTASASRMRGRDSHASAMTRRRNTGRDVGSIVMALTGLMIWYSSTSTAGSRAGGSTGNHDPLLRAILATRHPRLAFYHVIFDPDVYPMNWAWYERQDGPRSTSRKNTEERGNAMSASTEAGRLSRNLIVRPASSFRIAWRN